MPDEPYFNGKDACTIFGYYDPQKALQKHVEDEDRKHLARLAPGSAVNYHEGKAVYITELGFYDLAFKCKLPVLFWWLNSPQNAKALYRVHKQ